MQNAFSGNHCYQVQAYDAAGNYSQLSESSCVDVPEQTISAWWGLAIILIIAIAVGYVAFRTRKTS